VTSTTYLSPGVPEFTSTAGNTVLVGVDVHYNTITKTISAGKPAYTSTIVKAKETIAGTVEVGVPCEYVTSTSWCPSQATSTIGGTIVICNAQTTTTKTSTLPASATPYTSTVPAVRSIPGTVIVGSPVPYVTSTSLGDSRYTSTVGGTVIIGYPQSTTTVTTSLPASAKAFTSTIPAYQVTPGTVVIGQPSVVPTVTITRTSGTAPVATKTTNNGATCTVEVVVPEATIAPSCNNGGIQYAIYNNPFSVDNNNRSYPAFDPSYFQRAAAETAGLSTTLSYLAAGIKGETVCAYGSITTVPASKFVIDHKAYLYGAEAGTYTFTSYNADDYTGLWTGSFATRDYTRQNEVFEHLYYNGHQSVKSYTVTLRQGQYMPFRLMYANGGGAAVLNYTITAPSGRVVVSDSTRDTAPYVVQSSCDGSQITPAFKPWGAEIY